MKGSKGYWVDKKSGELFVASGVGTAKFFADTSVEVLDYNEFTVEHISPTVEVLKIYDNFGEPSINSNIFKIGLVAGKVELETKTSYGGTHPNRSIDLSTDKHALLIDGATLYEVDGKGVKTEKHDLKALTGYNDDTFQVEFYDDEYMVVRPYFSGWLTLINRETKEATRLADHVLNEEQLAIYKTADFSDITFSQWEGLSVIGREGNKLKLNHYWFLGGKETELIFNLTK
ncbi:hypothetical protein I6N90_20210 [Paenibacillus sp. GSMTC-2017]|nr:hypothetical protein [Paenibacillus sp. GSMTC-2017]